MQQQQNPRKIKYTSIITYIGDNRRWVVAGASVQHFSLLNLNQGQGIAEYCASINIELVFK